MSTIDDADLVRWGRIAQRVVDAEEGPALDASGEVSRELDDAAEALDSIDTPSTILRLIAEIGRLQDQLAKLQELFHFFLGDLGCADYSEMDDEQRQDVANLWREKYHGMKDHLATAREALAKIADTRRMGSYVHASNVQTKFVYAQRWAAAALENLTIATGESERKP